MTTREYKPNGAARALTVQVWRCGDCPYVHVTALDHDGPICEIVFSDGMASAVTEASLYDDYKEGKVFFDGTSKL